MFTGIVAGRGTVLALENLPEKGTARLVLAAGEILDGMDLGGSIAVNGVCLSAVELAGGTVAVDVMGETLRRTTTGSLAAGDTVNLERCVPAGGRLDGHVVQGHVDGVGTLLHREKQGAWDTLRFSVPRELGQYIAEKGSIAVDGVSLTVTAVSRAAEQDQWFEVGLIPVTLAATGLGAKEAGGAVNLEVDVLAKYAKRLLEFATGGAQ
ncbi:riboflavin synthase [Arthrobacter stackebrandtii]|uniref:Riboflavin synthase n=1 Tax=Arthrobacter stackebrandtii TaxID=272161 RepID=A0ABS4Z1P2_9MICC|nr:riboflavin synthase [Arthrobacter stackebrandtii]MBP2414869.1 riboflavin synthase [Arthrobacter stackebrandtii]PYG98772.1 riboflavin synthase [Arthrobacter stackebrandtii]